MVIKHSQKKKIEIAWRGKPSVGENGRWGNRRYMCEKSESPFILACGPHFWAFSLSVMTWCGTHTLVGCVTNEGVLTFRCFPSKSQLKNRHIIHRGLSNLVPLPHVHMFFKRTILFARPKCFSAVARTGGFVLRSKQKGLVSFQAQREQKQVWALHEGRQTNLRETHETYVRCLFCPCCGSSL